VAETGNKEAAKGEPVRGGARRITGQIKVIGSWRHGIESCQGMRSHLNVRKPNKKTSCPEGYGAEMC